MCYHAVVMGEKRVIRATTRALPLVTDIIDSTTYLYSAILPVGKQTSLERSESELRAGLATGNYLIGFQDHLPFGFVGAEKVADCCRLVGPCLYREYLGQGYGKYLLDFGLKLARGTGLNPIFLLIHKQADWGINFFCRWGFERLSDDIEFIKRWHDGLLADWPISPDQLLMALLLDISADL